MRPTPPPARPRPVGPVSIAPTASAPSRATAPAARARALAARAAAPLFAAALLASLAAPDPASAQAPADTAGARAEVLAVVEATLEEISREDFALDAMLEGGVLASAGTREGEPFHRIRTRAEVAASAPRADFVERGFDPEVRISGPLAMVWIPYDFYVDGEWSHCGVDIFTLLRAEGAWRIATITYSVEQPPACRKHPEGPPAG